MAMSREELEKFTRDLIDDKIARNPDNAEEAEEAYGVIVGLLDIADAQLNGNYAAVLLLAGIMIDPVATAEAVLGN